MGYDGSTYRIVALSWLTDMEKILDKSIQCPDEYRVRIDSFMLEENVTK